MSQWMVKYWGRNGAETVAVNAPSSAVAVRLTGLPPARIVRVERQWAKLWSATVWTPKPSQRVQLLFLVRACAMYSGTGRVHAGELIDEFGALKRLARSRPQVRRADLELSDRIRGLNFDDVLVSLVRAGERTGGLAASLRVAVDYLKMSERIRGATSSQFVLAFLLFGASCLTFFAMPVMLSGALQSLINVRAVQIELTAATHLMLWMDAVLRAYWPLVCGGMAAALGAAWMMRERLRRLRLFAFANRLQRIKRSARLMMVWMPYQIAGLVLEKETALLKRILGENAAAKILPRLGEGESLGDVLDRRWFSETLVQVGRGLSGAYTEDFKRIGAVALEALTEERQMFTRRLATLLYFGGALATMGVVALVAFGLIFPILGATTGV